MTSHRTAWAVAASLLAHLAVLGWMPSLRGTATWPPAQDHSPPYRTLHAVLLPPPTSLKQPVQSVVSARKSNAASNAWVATGARRSAAPRLVASPAALQPSTEQHPREHATGMHSAATAAPRPNPVTSEARAEPLDLALPLRRSIHAPRPSVAGLAGKGPVAPEPSVAEAITSASQQAHRHEARTGPVSVREQRTATQAQAEVHTPWGRYCMRERVSSRMAELHDSPFGRGMQSTTCPDG